MINKTPSQPIGIDGQYLGACARPAGLFTGLSNPRGVRESELDGRECTRCKTFKEADAYNLRVGPLKDGTRALYSLCRVCNAEALKADYEKNKPARSAHNKAFRQENIEHYRAYESRPERRGRSRRSSTRQQTCTVCGVIGGASLFFSRTSWKTVCGPCRKTAKEEKSKNSNRARTLAIAKQRRIDDENPRTCATCGYVGKQGEFYSNRVLRDTCKPCRWDERNAKITQSHAERAEQREVPDEKICPGCGESKPADQFRKSKTKNDYATLAPRCKPCETLKRAQERQAKTPEQLREEHKAQAKAARERNAPKRAVRRQARDLRNAITAARTEKACTKCEDVKSLDFFTRNSRSLDGHGGLCKACQAAEASHRRALDPEGYLEKMRARNAKDPSKAKKVQESRKAALQHPQWADPADIRVIFAEAERISVETGEPYAVDHVWPLKNPKVCGLHVAANLRVVPRRTNSKKLNKLPGFLRDQLWDPDASDVYYQKEEQYA